MGVPSRGKSDFLQLGDWNAVCFECGRKFKASDLKRHWKGYYVCPSHWEPRQPQDFVRGVQDTQTPPWTQPMPADQFVPITYARALNDVLPLADSVTFSVSTVRADSIAVSESVSFVDNAVRTDSAAVTESVGFTLTLGSASALNAQALNSISLG